VTTAFLYGLIASSGFLIGVTIGLFASPPRRVLAAVVAFGAGTLVCALTFELMEEAFETGTTAWSLGGFLLGAAVYVLLDQGLERAAAESPRRRGRDPQDVKPGAEHIPQTSEQATVSGMALLAGTVLDGVPENAAIGMGLAAEKGPGLGLVLLGAVFLSNLPGSMTSAVGMRAEGRSTAFILIAWSIVGLACIGACVLGYALLGGLPASIVGAILAFAAGGILAMLADTMMPEAFENGGPWVAMATAAGFASAFMLARVA
jgi:zinc transporter, ZIP family